MEDLTNRVSGCAIACVRSAAVALALAVGTVAAGETVASAVRQPDVLKLSAESMELNRQTGDQVLTGKVLITRGDISISANRVTVSTRSGAIYRIRGSGSPIRFTQRLNNGEVIQTQSSEIDYVTSTWTLVFRGEVLLERGIWQVGGELVEYNIRTRDFRVSKGGTEESRVRFTYGK